MAAHQFGRYIWLIDVLRKHPRITFERIASLWQECGLGDGSPMPWRTFMEHKKRCETIFDIVIECDRRHGYVYYIANSDSIEGEGFRNWLIDSYAVLNQVQSDRRLTGRIIFEDVPSGNTWLTTISDAISKSHSIEVSHRGFDKKEPNTVEIEPYFLKVVKRRWYLVGRSVKYSRANKELNSKDGGNRDENVFRIYALDRMLNVSVTDRHFDMIEGFDIGEYFHGCMGVIPNDGTIEDVIVRAYGKGASYIRSLPLHQSQRELQTNPDGSVDFSYHICPNNDFIQTILMQGDLVEVISPISVRNKFVGALRDIASRYSSPSPIQDLEAE